MVAIMLTIIAFFSVYDSSVMIYQIIVPPSVPTNLISVINALLRTITIIALFETVTVCFRTTHGEVRVLLVTGLTGMVRHVLVYNRECIDSMTLYATVSSAGCPDRRDRSRQTRILRLTTRGSFFR